MAKCQNQGHVTVNSTSLDPPFGSQIPGLPGRSSELDYLLSCCGYFTLLTLENKQSDRYSQASSRTP